MNRPEEWLITSPIPETVSVTVQTDEVTLETISPQSFQAVIDLSTATLGLQRVPVEVKPMLENVRILSVEPPQVDITLVGEQDHATVAVVVADPESLPPSYQLLGKPQATPNEIQVSGPAPVSIPWSGAEVTLFLNGTTTSVRTLLPVKLIDEAGMEVTGLTLEPSQVLVTATIRREDNVRDVGVRVVSEVRRRTATGLAQSARCRPRLRSAVRRPIWRRSVVLSMSCRWTSAKSEASFGRSHRLSCRRVSSAIGADGRAISSVTVIVETTPLIGELVLTREVEVQGLPADAVFTVEPAVVRDPDKRPCTDAQCN